MAVPRWVVAGLAGWLVCGGALVGAQTAPRNLRPPQLQKRPAPVAGMPGSIHLDVLVTNPDGSPVGGLAKTDFTLLDNGKPRPLLGFRAVSGATQDEPPVEVILLLDETNTYLHEVVFERAAVEQYLRQNGGRLAYPTTVMFFTDHGVQTETRPVTNGNELAAQMAKMKLAVHEIPLAGGYDAVQRLQESLQALHLIASVEATKPGRKLLLWVGHGWPMLESDSYQSDRSERSGFNTLVEMTQQLRAARITMYLVNAIDPSSNGAIFSDRYRAFLKPALSKTNFQTATLSAQIFATHSGGLVLTTSADLVTLLNRCVAEAEPFYTVSFDPPAVKTTDEYHAVTVTVDRPGLTARTWAGYYAEPAPAP